MQDEEYGSDMYKRWLEDLTPAEYTAFKAEQERRMEPRGGEQA